MSFYYEERGIISTGVYTRIAWYPSLRAPGEDSTARAHARSADSAECTHSRERPPAPAATASAISERHSTTSARRTWSMHNAILGTQLSAKHWKIAPDL